MISTNGMVRELLARHSRRAVSRIQPEMLLEKDLDLTPLELVLVALDIEDIEEVSVDVDGLEKVRSVGDLMTFFARCLARVGVRESRHPALIEQLA